MSEGPTKSCDFSKRFDLVEFKLCVIVIFFDKIKHTMLLMALACIWGDNWCSSSLRKVTGRITPVLILLLPSWFSDGYLLGYFLYCLHMHLGCFHLFWEECASFEHVFFLLNINGLNFKSILYANLYYLIYLFQKCTEVSFSIEHIAFCKCSIPL